MEEQVDDDYSSVVEILLGMFGEVLCKDAIATIVESCGGNLEESANVIMNITTDGEDSTTEENQTQVLDSNLVTITGQNKIDSHVMPSSNIQVPQMTGSQVMAQNTMVYSQAIQSQAHSSTGALPKQLPQKPVHSKEEPEELRQILKYHKEGLRTLILMRGAPGSGKSYMAKMLIDKIYNSRQFHLYSTHIFSTDDYFSQNSNHTYCFQAHKLPEAHIWNQQRSYLAMRRGVSPVIIDNTNIEIWEMECYIREGVKNGYTIFLLEPNTPWAWKANQLARRNMHNVPAFKIARMIDNYQHVTIKELLRMLNLSYNTRPPVLRLIPEFTPKAESLLIKPQTVTSNNIIQNKDKIDDKMKQLQINSNLLENTFVNEREDKESTADVGQQHSEETSEIENVTAVYKEVEKKLEEFAKVEHEWENSGGWDDSTSNIDKINKVSEPDQYVKPQRRKKSVKAPSENILSSIGDIQDWSKMTMFMPTWNETRPTTEEDLIIPIEKVSSSTCMEIDDTNLSSTKNPLKIISATPRDINEFYVRDVTEKIPETRMLDKSTSTNNDTMSHTGRCKNEEKHFNEFRKLFKFIDKGDLRDIFDKCQGDVNWAVDIVLNDVSYTEVLNENLSDSETEEENNEQCECIAAYSVIPDINSSMSDEIETPPPMEVPPSPLPEKRKAKKAGPLSNASVKLKQQIEQNIVISHDHYSDHCLKVRKKRHGEVHDEKTEKQIELVPAEISQSNLNELNVPSTSKLISTENSDIESIDDESLGEEPEQTISIDVSKDLMSQLDQHFGWKEMIFSENISTKINVPISILNELNALWIESLLYQIEENEKQLEIMVKQDEEFARELAYKEAELLQAGEKPRIPDFKEIMDMDFAVSLYHKDVAQWRNNEPNDLAAKLTRDKLKTLFPGVLSDLLAEILMAHDNNFQRTVESLLVSTGRGDILLEENGISKFIMEKETEQREKLVEKENEGLSETEWPSLPVVGLSETEWPSLPVIEKIDMEVVKKYRLEAEKHLKFRNMAHQKAQEMMRRGIIPAASYYSDIAAYHKTKYEHSNSYAAASLMHLHANNSVDGDTVDLHYLHVKEAKESLDLFLDEHIQRLRSGCGGSGGRYQKLFLITGRGLHSNGRPRIKPAVKKRLKERGLSFGQCNPGLLSAKVCADDKLSYQVG